MEQPEQYKNHFARIIMLNGTVVDEPLLGYALGGIVVDWAGNELGICFDDIRSYKIYEREQLALALQPSNQ